MYRNEDEALNRAQLRSRWLVLGGAALALLTLTLVSFLLRWPEAVTVLLSSALLAACIFGYSMFIAPVAVYGKHIDHALHGKTRETAGMFAGMEAEAVERDGLRFYPMSLNVGATLKDNGDRLFYYDANLPRPDWREGENLVLTSYDNRVTDWRRAAQ